MNSVDKFLQIQFSRTNGPLKRDKKTAKGKPLRQIGVSGTMFTKTDLKRHARRTLKAELQEQY